ncbi:ECF transporter S component [Microbacterium sp. RD1]|uniref:ECF transporter S component n=1 Tax=Microbacterium sp. RD1 TaxID=3457313 RepID=UPI003FA5679C
MTSNDAPAPQSGTPKVVRSKSFFTPVRISRMAILVALSAVGAFIKIPTPTGDAGLDSVPAYFAAMMKKWDWKEAAIIAILARLLAAAVVGFPLGLPAQIVLAFANASWVAVIVRIARIRWGYIAAIVATLVWAVILTLFPALGILFLGLNFQAAFAFGIAGLPGLLVAAGIAVVIAVAAARAVQNTAIAK